MNWYFVALFATAIFNLGFTFSKHGEPKEEKYNFWTSFFCVVVQMWLVIGAIKIGF